MEDKKCNNSSDNLIIPVKSDKNNYEKNCFKNAKFPLEIYIDNFKKFKNHELNAHYQNFMEINYLLKGKVKYSLFNNEYVMNQNDLLLISPNVLHKANDLEKESMVIGISFSLSIINANENTYLYDKYIKQIINNYDGILLKNNVVLHGLFEKIRLLYDVYLEHEFEILAYLNLIIKEIVDSFSNTTNVKIISKSKDANADLINDVIKYLEDNYYEDIKINDLVSRFNLSRSQLFKLFKNYTGLTPLDYLEDKRLIVASSLLRNTNSKIVDISNSVGFNTESYFIKCFKRKYKITPKQFKKALIQQKSV